MVRKIPIRFVECEEDSDAPKVPIEEVVPPQASNTESQQENGEPGPALLPKHHVEHQRDADQKRGYSHNKWTWKEVVEFLTLVAVFGALFATCQQNGIMRRQLVLAERPWLTAEVSITRPLALDPKGDASLQIEQGIKNVGKSVAVEVVPFMELVPFDVRGGHEPVLELQRDRCDKHRITPLNKQKLTGTIIFPAQKKAPRLTINLAAPAEEIAKVFPRAPEGPDEGKAFVVVGCISYRAAFETAEDKRHQTRFMFEVIGAHLRRMYVGESAD